MISWDRETLGKKDVLVHGEGGRGIGRQAAHELERGSLADFAKKSGERPLECRLARKEEDQDPRALTETEKADFGSPRKKGAHKLINDPPIQQARSRARKKKGKEGFPHHPKQAETTFRNLQKIYPGLQGIKKKGGRASESAQEKVTRESHPLGGREKSGREFSRAEKLDGSRSSR